MYICSKWAFVIGVLFGLSASAAEPKTIEELKEHFASVAVDKDSYTATFTIRSHTSSADSVDEMAMEGKIIVRGEEEWMRMSTTALKDHPELDFIFTGAITADKIWHMRVKVPTSKVPPVRVALSAIDQISKELQLPFNVPAVQLNSMIPGAGLMTHPSKILDALEDCYDLTLKGKESLDGEEVYVIKSRMKPEVLTVYQNYPELEGTFDIELVICIGAQDGVMRKLIAGSAIVMVVRDIDFEATIEDEDFVLAVPEGEEELDMTEEMLDGIKYRVGEG